MNTIIPSAFAVPKSCLAGHIGVGHAYSHSGFVQEDSVGFATVLEVLRRACPMDFSIAAVEGEGDFVCVRTAQGGVGQASSLRGFTPYERDMMQRAVGELCLAPQTLCIKVFGRMYGQGTHEPAVAFALALAKAYVNTVQRAWPEATVYAVEDVPQCCGEFLGGTVSIDAVAVGWLLSVNAAEGGIGPIEDAEGTIPIGNKGHVMAAIGMDCCPTLILESKAYVPCSSQNIKETTLFARWNKAHDNPVVGQCLVKALQESGQPFKMQDDAYPRNDALAVETKRIGNLIAQLGSDYASASSSAQKVSLAYALANIVRQDMGGSIFMSEAIFQHAGAGGLWPGHGAVLSCLCTRDFLQRTGAMTIADDELHIMADVAIKTMQYVAERHDEAQKIVLDKRPPFTPAQLLAMITA